MIAWSVSANRMSVAFGSKRSASLTGDGLARVDQLRWDEGHDVPGQVEAYTGAISSSMAYALRANRWGDHGKLPKGIKRR